MYIFFKNQNELQLEGRGKIFKIKIKNVIDIFSFVFFALYYRIAGDTPNNFVDNYDTVFCETVNENEIVKQPMAFWSDLGFMIGSLVRNNIVVVIVIVYDNSDILI
jgi:hypothetical protein